MLSYLICMSKSLWPVTIISPCMYDYSQQWAATHVVCKSLKLQIIVTASNVFLPKAVIQWSLKISSAIKDQSSSTNALEDKPLIACFWLMAKGNLPTLSHSVQLQISIEGEIFISAAVTTSSRSICTPSFSDYLSSYRKTKWHKGESHPSAPQKKSPQNKSTTKCPCHILNIVINFKTYFSNAFCCPLKATTVLIAVKISSATAPALA